MCSLLIMEYFIEKKVYYHDTDCGGVVYYANYLKYFEEARTELFLAKGIELGKLAKRNVLFVVGQAILNYKAPARYQDILKISSRVERIKNVSIQFVQIVKRDNTFLVNADITLVCIDNNFKPISIPAEIKQSLNA